MILVYVKEKNGEEVCWELPIRSAKSREHLIKRITKMLKDEYKDEPFEILNGLAPLH